MGTQIWWLVSWGRAHPVVLAWALLGSKLFRLIRQKCGVEEGQSLLSVGLFLVVMFPEAYSGTPQCSLTG